MSKAITIFCSYAPEDEKWFLVLEYHLSTLRQHILLWHSRMIPPGANAAEERDRYLQEASIILLFVSAYFFSRCEAELELALKRYETGLARVIPILVQPVHWQDAPFARLQVIPANEKPLALWRNRDEALQQVVTELRRLITPDLPQTAAPKDSTTQSPFWNFPYPPSAFFTGREKELESLHTQLQTQQRAAIGQTHAITGLGGIGKTRLAVEYAYRYREEYSAILWANASSKDTLTDSYRELAHLLNLLAKDVKEQQAVVLAVKAWLSRVQNFLLILDNADELDVLPDFIPPTLAGHLLLTTRAQAVRSLNIADPLPLETLPPEQGALFLLHRAGLLTTSATLDQAAPELQEQAQTIAREFDGLPLALEQAGAYIEETHMSLADYLQIYQQYRTRVFEEHQLLTYPATVATTWAISFNKVEQKNPAAADLLRICAFLAPDVIPESMLTRGAEALGPQLAPVLHNPLALNQAFAALNSYSLIRRKSSEQTLSLHRLVQAVLRDSMERDQQQVWAERVLAVLNLNLPTPQARSWQEWLPYLPQISIAAQLIDEYDIVSEEAAKLLSQAGVMLRYYSRVEDAQKMSEKAVSLLERLFGTDNPKIVATLNGQAKSIANQSNYEEALRLFERSQSICERAFGPDDPQTATTLAEIAHLYSRWGRFEESERLYEKILDIRTRALGSDHPETVATLVAFATMYSFWKKYDQAEMLLVEALRIKERTLGSDHSETIALLDALADIYHRQQKYDQAEGLFKRILDIREQAIKPDPRQTANASSRLARLYCDQGAYEQSLQLYERTLALRREFFGTDNPDATVTCFGMGQLSMQQGDYVRAVELFHYALETHERVLGRHHHKIGKILEEYSKALRKLGRDEEAAQMEGRAKAIRGQGS